jgi:hypothetical protein
MLNGKIADAHENAIPFDLSSIPTKITMSLMSWEIIAKRPQKGHTKIKNIQGKSNGAANWEGYLYKSPFLNIEVARKRTKTPTTFFAIIAG